MGTYEILAKSSEESLREDVKVETPSPLTSSNSSAADSSKSLLNRINDLVVERRTNSSTDRKFQRESLDEESISKFINFGEKSNKRETNLASIVGTSSSSSSPSSLRQRIRDFPTSGDSIKFSDSLAALNRRIRRERDFYLQLQGLNERIDEKDEGEANSDEISTITKSRKGVRGRARATAMCSSAPETMRAEKMNYSQRHLTSKINDNLTRGRSKKLDESRPSQCQRPIEQPSRKIIRSNAPPLCLTDEKILRLLRRGSSSAREETMKRGTERSLGKLAAYGKPTGVIIESLTSGSENDARVDRTNDRPFSKITRPEMTEFRRGNFPLNHSRIDKSIDESLMASSRDVMTNGARRTKNREDSSENSESRKSCERFPGSGLQTDEATTERGSRRNIVRSKDKDPVENRWSTVPKLDIKSQEYSRSTSIASGERATKMPLDVDELLRALSDVSIKRQIDRQIAWADRHFPIPGTRASCTRSTNIADDQPTMRNESDRSETLDHESRITSGRWKNRTSSSDDIERKMDTKNRDCRNWMEAGKIGNSRSTESAISSENSPGKLKMDCSTKRRRSKRREKNFETRNHFRSMDRLRKIDREFIGARERGGGSENEGQEIKPSEQMTNYGDEVRGRSIMIDGEEDEREDEQQRRNGGATARMRARESRSTERERVISSGLFMTRQNDSNEKSDCPNSPGQSRFSIYEDSFENRSKEAPFCMNKSTSSSPLVQTESKRKISMETETRSRMEENNIRSVRSRENFQNRSTSRCGAKRRLSKNLSMVDNSSSEPSNREFASSRDSQSQDSPERSDTLAGSFSYELTSSRIPPKLSEDANDSIVATAKTASEDISDHKEKVSAENFAKDLASGEKENLLPNENREVLSSRSIMERLSRDQVRHTEMSSKDETRRTSRCKLPITDEFERDASALEKSRDHRICKERISSSLSRLQPSSWQEESAIQDRPPFVIINGETSTRLLTEMRGESGTIYRSDFIGPACNEFGFSMAQTIMANDLPNSDSRYIANWENRAAIGPLVPRIRSFVDKFQRWRKRRENKTRGSISNAPTTRILYENNECRAEEISSRSVTMTNDDCSNAERNRDRDGLWVVGFEAEKKLANANDERDKKISDTEASRNVNVLSACQPEIDAKHGCFCASFCRFLIGRRDCRSYRLLPEKASANEKAF